MQIEHLESSYGISEPLESSQALASAPKKPTVTSIPFHHQSQFEGEKYDKAADQVTKLDVNDPELLKLKQTDRSVRQHEHAHLAAAGQYAQGGPTYEYVTGPDGRSYAVAGEVQIDTSPEDTPEETIKKAQTIKRAAMAPASPSSQDRAVAAKAAQMEIKARAEQAQEKGEESHDLGLESNSEAEAHDPTTCPLCSGKGITA